MNTSYHTPRFFAPAAHLHRGKKLTNTMIAHIAREIVKRDKLSNYALRHQLKNSIALGLKIQEDVIHLLKKFKKDRIVAMYETCDNGSNKYRIQIHFRNAKESYCADDEKAILQFLKKYFDQGFFMFSFFEQIFIQLVHLYLKDLFADNFTQVNDRYDENFLFFDSAARESRCCETCLLLEKNINPIAEMQIKAIALKRRWLTVNQDNGAFLWDTFYQSLISGYATIGYEDYVTGITIRGAMTEENGIQAQFSPARGSYKRYAEKKKDLNEKLETAKCNYCSATPRVSMPEQTCNFRF